MSRPEVPQVQGNQSVVQQPQVEGGGPDTNPSPFSPSMSEAAKTPPAFHVVERRPVIQHQPALQIETARKFYAPS